MSEMKYVALTSTNCEKHSRQKLLEFVNCKSARKYSKVEDLCSGIAYCEIMETIFPDSIGQRRIKREAKVEYEFIHNLRLLQSAFKKLNYNKAVPIERLIKGRFQDNLEFLQWFKKFYDSVQGKENQSQAANVMNNSLHKSTKAESLSSLLSPSSSTEQTAMQNDSMKSLDESIVKTKEQIEEIKNERDFFSNKVAAVKAYLQKQKLVSEEDVILKESLLKIIDATANE